MTDQETIQMLQRCREEILSLRRVIAELAPKADAYDHMCKVLNLLPQPSQAYGEDLAWRLAKHIEEMQEVANSPDNEPAIAEPSV